MKKLLSALLAILLVPMQAFAVTQEEYDKVVAERDTLYQQLVEAGLTPVTDLTAEEETSPLVENAGEYTDFFHAAYASEEWKSIITSGDYYAIADLLMEYASTPKDERDPVYQLLPGFIRLKESQERTFVDTEPFDGTSTLRWTGLTEISEEVCVVPYRGDTGLKMRLGFISDDWVFFNKIAISLNGEVIYSSSFKTSTQRDTLGGGKIIEWVETAFQYDVIFDDIIDDIRNGAIPVIRFSNSEKDKKYDHVMTETEAIAFADFFTYKNASELFGNLSWHYQSRCRDIDKLVTKDSDLGVYPAGMDPTMYASLICDFFVPNFHSAEEGEPYRGTVFFDKFRIYEKNDGYVVCSNLAQDWAVIYQDESDLEGLEVNTSKGTSILGLITYLGKDSNNVSVFYLGVPSQEIMDAITIY